jgi:NAD(P)-dependent dehydrogenase (short-subunit alcohol dehydrogenase family)
MAKQRPLEGKTAFITGGAGGIGSACARRLAEDGAAVMLMGRTPDSLKKAQSALRKAVKGAEIGIFAGNGSSSADVAAAAKAAHAMRGRLDVVLTTVGGGGGVTPIVRHTEDSFRAIMESNFMSVFIAVRQTAPLMDQGGSIICISSTAGKMNFPFMADYCTAKAAVEAFIKSAAEELGSANIRVNAVRPGLTYVSRNEALFSNKSVFGRFVEQTPLDRGDGRLGTTDDIAGAVRFLAGPDAAWVTGQSFAVDGGHELRRNPDLSDLVVAKYGARDMKKIRRGKA